MKLIKKLFWLVAALFVGIASAGILYVYLNQNKILEAAIAEINHHLAVEVAVESMAISAFDDWPLVSIILENVSTVSEREFSEKLIDAAAFM